MKSFPFTLRDIIFTPRHVRLACDPPRPPKQKKGIRSLKRQESVASSSFSYNAPPERNPKSKSKISKRRPRTYSQPLAAVASGRQNTRPIGSLPLKDTLQMKRFSLMRRRRTLSSVDFDGSSCC